MKISHSLLPNLQVLLSRFDERRDALLAYNALVVPAEAAACRLKDRLAEIEGQLAELAAHHIPADPDRISRLIAGDDVQQLAAAEIEARALKTNIISAQRRQIAEDVAAVWQHLSELRAEADRIRQATAAAEEAFLRALADAMLDAYKLSALEFVRTNMPPLHSIAKRVWDRTGQRVDWINRVFPGLQIHWLENEKLPDPKYPDSADYFVFKKTVVWPPGPDNVLVSGEPVLSDDLVDSIIAGLRAPHHGPHGKSGSP